MNKFVESTSSKTGRTYPDLISEYPKIFFTVFVILLITLIVIIFFVNRPVKVGPVDIGAKVESVKDTTPTVKSSINVKHGDTTVKVVNQPANINTGDNKGIIGNYNTITINPEKPQRKLRPKDKTYILQKIATDAKQMGIDSIDRITISSVSGDNEAANFGFQVRDFLKTKYPRVGGATAFPSDKATGISIALMRTQPGIANVEILVGTIE